MEKTEFLVNLRHRFRVGWGDLDGNNHMANRAFLDRASDTRFFFFAQYGYPIARFASARIGPVILHDELEYRKELRLLDECSVDLEFFGFSPEGTRFDLGNTFRNSTEETVAIVRSKGLWFDLETRKPCTPPPDLDEVQRRLPRGEGFQDIPARSR